jgi:hypothetical protein
MKEYFSVLEGEAYQSVCGDSMLGGDRWKVAKQGLNERLRFLKYGPGQFFKGILTQNLKERTYN